MNLTCYIFIDGSWYYSYQKSSAVFEDANNKMDLDIAKLNTNIIKLVGTMPRFSQYKLVQGQCHWFGSKPENNTTSQEVQYKIQKSEKFIRYLTKIGVCPHYQTVDITSSNPKEKGVDVDLSVTAVYTCMVSRPDVLIFVLGDADFLPMLDLLFQNVTSNIIIATNKSNCSYKIIEKYPVIYIDEHDMKSLEPVKKLPCACSMHVGSKRTKFDIDYEFDVTDGFWCIECRRMYSGILGTRR